MNDLSNTALPETSICDVCQGEPAVGVAGVPGLPISVAYGKACLAANAHPYGLLVANTALLGDYAHSADWWQEMVNATLAHLDKTRDQFDADVAESNATFEREMAEHEAEETAPRDNPLTFHPAGCICSECGGITTESRWTGGENRG